MWWKFWFFFKIKVILKNKWIIVYGLKLILSFTIKNVFSIFKVSQLWLDLYNKNIWLLFHDQILSEEEHILCQKQFLILLKIMKFASVSIDHDPRSNQMSWINLNHRYYSVLEVSLRSPLIGLVIKGVIAQNVVSLKNMDYKTDGFVYTALKDEN